MSVRVRFASGPTGPLHLGSALSAVASRTFADEHAGAMLLRIDDTDPVQSVPGGEESILADLEWLGVRWDEGPARQSERAGRYREAAAELGPRFGHESLLREDGGASCRLASVVDDGDFGITHVIRGNDHRSNEELDRRLHEALGTGPPEYLHHGRILGDDGQKLPKGEPGASVAALREAGIPAEAARAYLEELGMPAHDVPYDHARIRRLALETIAALDELELAARLGVPVAAIPVARGARDLREARAYVESILEPPAPAPTSSPETLVRFAELSERELDPRATVRELKAVGGDLRALRQALTGQDRGPELAAVLAALPRKEALRRVAAALAAGSGEGHGVWQEPPVR